MNNKRILLIGESGQLGSALKERFQKLETFFSLSRKELDITNRNQIRNCYEQYKPDVIINATAYTAVDKAEVEQEDAFKVNCQGVRNLVDCVPLECRIIHISTDFVFSGNSKSPLKISDKVGPINNYGLSKVCGEKRLIHGRRSQYLIFRTSWLYSEKSNNFVTSILRALKEKDELSVVSDQYGSPTSVYSLVDIVEKSICNNKVNGVFHWSDIGEISWYDFAIEIKNLAMEMGIINLQKPINKINSSEYNSAAKRPGFSVLDCSDTCKRFEVEQRFWKDSLYDVMKRISLQVND